MDDQSKRYFMEEALKEAKKAQILREVPIGAIIVNADSEIIGRGHNLIESKHHVGAHAELLAIEDACKRINNWRLNNCSLFVTLEPCPMCAGAIMLSRVSNVYYACPDPRQGGVKSVFKLCNSSKLPHQSLIEGGILEDKSRELLKSFFKELRATKLERP